MERFKGSMRANVFQTGESLRSGTWAPSCGMQGIIQENVRNMHFLLSPVHWLSRVKLIELLKRTI